MNPCTSYMIAMGSLYHSVTVLERERESPAQQRAIQALLKQIGMLETEYLACTKQHPSA